MGWVAFCTRTRARLPLKGRCVETIQGTACAPSPVVFPGIAHGALRRPPATRFAAPSRIADCGARQKERAGPSGPTPVVPLLRLERRRPCEHRPSTCRVCQFHHRGMLVTPILAAAPAKVKPDATRSGDIKYPANHSRKSTRKQRGWLAEQARLGKEPIRPAVAFPVVSVVSVYFFGCGFQRKLTRLSFGLTPACAWAEPAPQSPPRDLACARP